MTPEWEEALMVRRAKASVVKDAKILWLHHRGQFVALSTAAHTTMSRFFAAIECLIAAESKTKKRKAR